MTPVFNVLNKLPNDLHWIYFFYFLYFIFIFYKHLFQLHTARRPKRRTVDQNEVNKLFK